MMQRTFAIRGALGALGALACVIVLAMGAVFVNRALTANRDEVAPAAPEAMPKVDVPAMTPTAPAAPADARVTSAADSREASWREAREAAIRVQQRLRAEQQARKAAQKDEAKTERCIDGQRMRRVENGWVQAGNC